MPASRLSPSVASTAASAQDKARRLLGARLLTAVRRGWLDAAERHLREGANPNGTTLVNQEGTVQTWALLDVALNGLGTADRHAEAMTLLLLKAGADPALAQPSQLGEICALRKHALVPPLVDAGAPLNSSSVTDHPLAQMYVWDQSPMPIEWLNQMLYLGLNPNQRITDRDVDRAVLSYPAQALDVEAVQRLLFHGARTENLHEGRSLIEVVRTAHVRDEDQRQAQNALINLCVQHEREVLEQALAMGTPKASTKPRTTAQPVRSRL